MSIEVLSVETDDAAIAAKRLKHVVDELHRIGLKNAKLIEQTIDELGTFYQFTVSSLFPRQLGKLSESLMYITHIQAKNNLVLFTLEY